MEDNASWGLLETIFFTESIRIEFSDNELCGDMHAIDWRKMLTISQAIRMLSASVTGLPDSHFRLEEFIQKDGAMTRAGIKIMQRLAHDPLEVIQKSRELAQQHLLRTLTSRNVSQNAELPFDESFDADLQQKVAACAEPVLEKLGGKNLSSCLSVLVKGQDEPIKIRQIAEPPLPPVSDGTSKLRGLIDGYCKTKRIVFLLTENNSLQTVNFHVESLLDSVGKKATEKTMYDFVINDVVDSKGRPRKILVSIDDINEDELNDFQLT